MASPVVAIVEAVLSTQCEDDECRELRNLQTRILESPESRRSWLQRIEQEGSPELLRRFLLYAFVRAFTPVEVSLDMVLKPEALATTRSINALSRPLSNAQAILTLLNEATWSTQALGKLAKLIQQFEDPRARQHVLQFAFATIARLSYDASSDLLHAATPVMLLGVTDVWSAVRKESAQAASRIVFQFYSLDLIDSFIDSLLKIAASDAWKAHEGALLTLSGLLSAIKVDRTLCVATTTTTAKPPASTAVEMVKGTTVPPNSIAFQLGDRHRGLAQLPRSLAFKLKPALYMALKHAQVSVRETAAQCLVRYMGICDESTRVLTFQEVMSKLNRLAPPVEQDTELQNQVSAELLEAAEAEGLLDVLGKLVPHLPVQFLVKHWKLVFPTLERYVMHIASSVRLRSSAVVLALAELAQRDCSGSTASLELLHQMLMALADHRVDVGVCWQRLEGRLLSVDLLVGLLGKDHLWRRGSESCLLQFVSKPRKSPSDSWLSDGAVQATWTLDEEEEARFTSMMSMEASAVSIIDKLNSYVLSKKLSSQDMWQRVLTGWLSQTRAAFESRQFELRRIARQALPGLVRLSLWCNQVSLLKTASLLNTSADSKTGNAVNVDGWTWSCLRHLLLHAELVRGLSRRNEELQGMVSNTRAFTVSVLDSARSQEHKSTASHEPEAVVVRVEAVVMATLSFGQSTSSISSIEEELQNALLDIHASLPETFHHPRVLGCSSASSDGSLDRQFSITLVQLLPAIVKNTRTTKPEGHKLWCLMERIALSWLATDDMFRWITIDKNAAQASLLLALDDLLVKPNTETLVKDDEAFIIRTLESTVAINQLKESAASCLVRIYASLWRSAMAEPTSRIKVKIVKNLAFMDSQRRLSTSKGISAQPAKSDWDDWDGDGDNDDEEAGVTAKLQELRPLSATDETQVTSPVACELIRVLQSPHLAAFKSFLDQLVHSDDKTLLSSREALQGLLTSLVDI